jgi:hypothetical protein
LIVPLVFLQDRLLQVGRFYAAPPDQRSFERIRMNSDDRWSFLLALDNELLQGGAMLPEWVD